MLVYQLTFNILELKEDKGTKYIIAWKSKRLLKFKLHPLYNAFLPNTKRFGYKIRLQFKSTALVKEQNNYTIKIVNAYNV